MTIDSPIWDVVDCAPVLTEDQIEDRCAKIDDGNMRLSRHTYLTLRLHRYYRTADLLDAVVDGKFFSMDWKELIHAWSK